MLSRTVVVSNPAYLHVRDAQLVVRREDERDRRAVPGLRAPAQRSGHPREPLDNLRVLIIDRPRIRLERRPRRLRRQAPAHGPARAL